MPHYAHTLDGRPEAEWEPLFTPFDEADPSDPKKACSGQNGAPCSHCEHMEAYHGHLNKVAWWAAKFAAEWQTYLVSKADPHIAEATGSPAKKEDHSTAGAVFNNTLPRSARDHVRPSSIAASISSAVMNPAARLLNSSTIPINSSARRRFRSSSTAAEKQPSNRL